MTVVVSTGGGRSGGSGGRLGGRGGGRSYEAPPRWRGALAAALVPPVLTAVLDQLRQGLNLTSTALLFLAAVVAIARLGGMLSALAAALWASLLLKDRKSVV